MNQDLGGSWVTPLIFFGGSVLQLDVEKDVDFFWQICDSQGSDTWGPRRVWILKQTYFLDFGGSWAACFKNSLSAVF